MSYLIGKYLPWYKLIEDVFGNAVRELSEEEIGDFISEKDWMIVPLKGENDKNSSKMAPRPNLFFDLSKEGYITFGIVYEKLGSVSELRNILLPYNEKERNKLLVELSNLSDEFKTEVTRKTKEHHHFETPDYETVFGKKSNEMDFQKFKDAFEMVDRILKERDLLDGKQRFKLAPTVNLIYRTTKANSDEFADALREIQPVYSLILKMKNEEQIEACDRCLCFNCEDKGKYPECHCPCSGYPKNTKRVIKCYLSEEYD